MACITLTWAAIVGSLSDPMTSMISLRIFSWIFSSSSNDCRDTKCLTWTSGCIAIMIIAISASSPSFPVPIRRSRHNMTLGLDHWKIKDRSMRISSLLTWGVHSPPFSVCKRARSRSVHRRHYILWVSDERSRQCIDWSVDISAEQVKCTIPPSFLVSLCPECTSWFIESCWRRERPFSVRIQC